jgi:hypothetical protein
MSYSVWTYKRGVAVLILGGLTLERANWLRLQLELLYPDPNIFLSEEE